MPLKWIPHSKSGASKSRPRWAAHTRIGNVWEYPPPRGWHYGNRLTKLAFLRARAILREKERGPITISFDLLIWI